VTTNALNNISTDENLLAMYRSRKKSEMLHEHNMAVARNEGKAEGMFKKAIETAKNFLKMRLTPEQVAQGTGLSEEEIGSCHKTVDKRSKLCYN
jgi:predicted transposase/invertase (TIGR01784 family)